ncbi:MAG: hypothetical protein SGPRY_008564, partial [Prymnesium sp.]
TTLRAPAYDHVMIAFRHKDADTHAGGNKAHIALGLFRNVPKVDLDLILPHQQVKISHRNHSITTPRTTQRTPRSTPAPLTTLYANIPHQNTVHSAHHKTIRRSTPPHHTTTSPHTYHNCHKATHTQPHLESPNNTAFQVCMPSLHRTQFALMGLLTLGAGYPLLHQEALSLAGLVTLYTAIAYAARTAVRWRSTKQLYQQLLLSYQSSNRIGSSDGALLYICHLAEAAEKQTVLLSLKTLLHQQLHSRGGEISLGQLVERNRELEHHIRRSSTAMRHWRKRDPDPYLHQILILAHPQLHPSLILPQEHCDAQATLDYLRRLGVARCGAGECPLEEVKISLKPLDEAIAVVQEQWNKAPELDLEIESSDV